MLGWGRENELLLGCKKKGEMADGLKSNKFLDPLCVYCYIYPL